MFTVVIAPQKLIDDVREYEIFLKPFIDREKFAFCRWEQEERTLAESVPELAATVARREHWRAVVICDEAGLTRKNPFDLVSYRPPEEEPPVTQEEIDTFKPKEPVPDDYWDDPSHETPERLAERARQRRYFQRVLDAKADAFRQAAQLPLPRLMAYLCQPPMTGKTEEERGETPGGEASGLTAAEADPALEAYQKEAACKRALREEIRNGEKIGIFLPEEVYCIAKRTFLEPEYDVKVSWSKHTDHQYSRFYDWNLYFDRMRYLVFDILPANHQNYLFDYLRFLYTLLLFAGNSTPGGCMRPNRVYCLDCDNDEAALRRLIASYDEKLHNTELVLADEIKALAEKAKERMTDYEANSLFCSGVNVPVTLDQDFDQSGLYVDKKGYGLSTDCPSTEEGVWDAGYRKAEKTLYRLVKQPRRSLKRAAENLRRMNCADTDRVKLLSEFQMEDVVEFTNDGELGMVNTPTSDIYDLSRYRRQMEEEDRSVREVISTRMSRAVTLALGGTVLGLNLLCFLPMLLSNLTDGEGVELSLVLMGGAAALVALAGFVCLFFLRSALTDRINHFNGVMKDISDEISHSLLQFSLYLGYACNTMRGWSVINYYREHEDTDTLEIRVRKKHMSDIRGYRERLHEIFGMYFTDPAFADPVLAEAYVYNFGRPVDFDYSVPFMPGENRQIEYMQPGNEITVPVNFICRVTVRQEELYD